MMIVLITILINGRENNKLTKYWFNLMILILQITYNIAVLGTWKWGV